MNWTCSSCGQRFLKECRVYSWWLGRFIHHLEAISRNWFLEVDVVVGSGGVVELRKTIIADPTCCKLLLYLFLHESLAQIHWLNIDSWVIIIDWLIQVPCTLHHHGSTPLSSIIGMLTSVVVVSMMLIIYVVRHSHVLLLLLFMVLCCWTWRRWCLTIWNCLDIGCVMSLNIRRCYILNCCLLEGMRLLNRRNIVQGLILWWRLWVLQTSSVLGGIEYWSVTACLHHIIVHHRKNKLGRRVEIMLGNSSKGWLQSWSKLHCVRRHEVRFEPRGAKGWQLLKMLI